MAGPALGAYGVNTPSLSAYNPSWRDRLSAWAIGDSRDPVKQKLVQALLGSRGLGSTGVGMVDLTPAGIPLAVNDAQRSANEGDWTGATLNAMAMVPGAKAGTKALEAGINEARQGIRAYHGSPHDFDKFDLSKIGTGEGAQAYGHGLYFAESPGTADYYKKVLTQERGSTVWRGADGKEVDIHGLARQATSLDANPKGAESLAASFLRQEKSVDEALAFAQRLKPASFAGGEAERNAVIEGLQSFKAKGLTKQPAGRTYEVSINAHPDEFLDWDKPLSEQAPQVQQSLRQAMGEKKWAEFQHADGGTAVKNGFIAFDPGPGASDKLRSAGIKGIRYKDAGSRLSDAWKVRDSKGVAVNVFPDEKSARAYAAEYPEYSLEPPPKGTHNYVVFDDRIIDILKKYGIAGLTAGGFGALAAAGMAPTDAQASPGLFGVR